MSEEKVKRLPDGAYTWSCPVEAEYFRDTVRPGLYASIAAAAGLLIFGALLALPKNDMSVFLAVAGVAAVFLLLTGIFFGLFFSAKNPHEEYLLTDTYVRTGRGRTSVFFQFSKARRAIFTAKYIELQGKRAKMRVYVPDEDYPLVKDFMTKHLPPTCLLREG